MGKSGWGYSVRELDRQQHHEEPETLGCKMPELERNYKQMDEEACRYITMSQNSLKPILP